MKYLMIIKHAESFRSEPMPKDFSRKVGEFVNDAIEKGVLVDTAGLKGTSEGFRIRTRGGKLHLTDGPFTEAKEMIGGYAMVDVKSKEEAREFAKQFMELHREYWPAFEGECEVRPLDG